MAKRVKVTRKELLKEPDQFLSITQKISLYAADHQSTLMIGAGVLAVLLAIVFGYQYNQKMKDQRMESLYFKMVKVNQKEPGKEPKDTTGELETLLEQFSEGPQQVRASLLLAKEYFNQGKFDKAIALYTETLNRSNSDDLSNPLARVGLAYSYEGKKDYKKAVEYYKSLLDNSDAYPLFDVFSGLARCYELDNDRKNALLTLREMENKFQGHPQLESVERRIAKLSDAA